MKKEDFLSIFVFLLMLIIALFIGLRIISNANVELGYNTAQSYTFAIITIIVGVLINALIFELGHVLGALISGYKIMSVNIFGLCLYRAGKNWKLGFRSYNGLTGETKIFAKKEKASPKLHLFGPLIMFLIELAIAIVLFVVLPKDNIFHHAPLIVAGIGAILIVYNIMPFKLDTATDGYYLMLLSKKVNVSAYNELMRIQSLVHENKPLTDLKEFSEITTLTAKVNMYKYYEYLYDEKYEEALAIVENIISESKAVDEEMLGTAITQKLYILLVTKPKEAAELYWNNELTVKDRKFIANDLTIESLRTYLLFNAVVSKSESEAMFALLRFKKALKRHNDETRKEQEIALFDNALLKAKELNPTWKLEEHKA
ncbi:MAG: hypothetical protein ACOX28_03050 [Bacilli bacterium]|jgi:hypothetical protein